MTVPTHELDIIQRIIEEVSEYLDEKSHDAEDIISVYPKENIHNFAPNYMCKKNKCSSCKTPKSQPCPSRCPNWVCSKCFTSWKLEKSEPCARPDKCSYPKKYFNYISENEENNKCLPCKIHESHTCSEKCFYRKKYLNYNSNKNEKKKCSLCNTYENQPCPSRCPNWVCIKCYTSWKYDEPLQCACPEKCSYSKKILDTA